MNFEKDLILFSLLIHDGLKHGYVKDKYVKFEHPELIADHLNNKSDDLNFSEKELEIIKSAVKSHMGEWNTNNYSPLVLNEPVNRIDKFVHMCDFLASRKFIEIDFGGNDE